MISPSVPFSVFFVLLFFYLNVLQTTIAFPLSPYAKLLSRADHGGSNLSHRGMNTHVARILGISIIAFAIIIGAVFYLRRSRRWYLRHHQSQPEPTTQVPSFLQQRPVAGRIVFSSRTYALATNNRAQSASFPAPWESYPAAPQYNPGFQHGIPLHPPPPAYSSVVAAHRA